MKKPDSAIPIIAHILPAFKLLYDDSENLPGSCKYNLEESLLSTKAIIPKARPTIPKHQQPGIEKIPRIRTTSELGKG